MTPENGVTTRTDTTEPEVLKVVEPENAPPAATDPADTASDELRPEVREAFERSWQRHEAAYRHLGR